MKRVDVVFFLLITFGRSTRQVDDLTQINHLVTQWAPLVWMSPDEQYHPSCVSTFLENVHLANENGKAIMLTVNETHFPQINTKSLYLVTNRKLEHLIRDGTSSFLNGHNPGIHSVPAYVLVSPCTPNNSFRASDSKNVANDIIHLVYGNINPNLFFSVSYWMFYPFNYGKKICFLGKVPTLTFFGRCFGRLKTIGSHVGDWEHVSLSFRGNLFPSEMYISIHDTGGYYKFDPRHRHFKLDSKSPSKKVQKPKLPPIVRIQGGHPVLFAAEGSHGLWPAPGEHEYNKVPYLTDKCGYGTPWKTWKHLKIYSLNNWNLPKWLFFKGKWGNSQSNCVLRKLGLCEVTDGPEGIIRNKPEFFC